ncbi:hypothetical protein M3647_06495 [Paenibacillus cellulositrophicus]|uniref:hypothetical protein n=1 Tax=Paenibacillus cellulositrophicus TaxID=562959 RepID=UPI00203B8C43|nr:hypothetical protein [Paenibacillus cellulositrophicus]MCM2997113.1 hypothetical protein [Paenibacillus cellulositrophicus]
MDLEGTAKKEKKASSSPKPMAVNQTNLGSRYPAMKRLQTVEGTINAQMAVKPSGVQ